CVGEATVTFAIISVLASLGLILALNWEHFRAMGWDRVARMLLIWLGIIVGLGVLLRLFGL
ncbi:MAG: hypothetical protein ACK5SX_02070, partial [Sandaracinobacter sp.]